MRLLCLLFALPAIAGCFGEGLSSSPRDCPASQAVEDGFLVHINGTVPFAGYCLGIADREAGVDDDIAQRQVDEGPVYLPVPKASTYYIHMSVVWPGDEYCADHIGVFHDHPGQGIVEITVDNTPVCA